jgi:O-6-methylguanine DNA methyltransferase
MSDFSKLRKLKKIKEILTKQTNKYPKFYKKVWLETTKIPKGKVLTYKQLAQKIGFPKAYRLVGIALNKNPFAPVVPCHRVIKSDGSIGGYSKGIKQKIFLLKKEGVKIKKIGSKIKVEF